MLRDKMATQIYINNKTVPYSDLTITDNLQSANTIQFTSPSYIEDMSIVHVIGDHQPFGGFIMKRPEGETADYQYTGIDFTRLLNGKIYSSYYNKTSSQIILDLLEKRGMKTGGIAKTTKKHSKLIFKNKKAIDVCHQLANLESKTEFFVNSDGVAVLRKIPEYQKGYIFGHPSIFGDYDLSYDPTDIITGVVVIGENDKNLYSHSDKTLVAKYGHMSDVLEDSSLKTKTAAINAYEKQMREKGKIEFSGSLKTPILKDMKSGLYITLLPQSWSRLGVKNYYVQTVKTVINSNTQEQQI